jgi:hypothetical protein
VCTAEDQDMGALAEAMRRKSEERARVLIQDVLVQPIYEGPTKEERDAENDRDWGAVREQARRLGALVAQAERPEELPPLVNRDPCIEPPYSAGEVRQILDANRKEQMARAAQGAARASAESDVSAVLAESAQWTTPGEQINAQLGYAKFLGGAERVMGIAINQEICGRAGPIDGPPPQADPGDDAGKPKADPDPEEEKRRKREEEKKKREEERRQREEEKRKKKEARERERRDEERRRAEEEEREREERRAWRDADAKRWSGACANVQGQAVAQAGSGGMPAPSADVARLRSVGMRDEMYAGAADDLVPNDWSARNLASTGHRAGFMLGQAGGSVHQERVIDLLSEAETQRRLVVDTAVSSPEETFAGLIEASRAAPGMAAQHVLLSGEDVAAGVRLHESLRNPALRAGVVQLAEELKGQEAAIRTGSPTRAGPLTDRLMGLHTALTGAGGDPAARPVPTGKMLESTKVLVQRAAAALPVMDALDAARSRAVEIVGAERADLAAAQVFYAEVIGKESLLASRRVSQVEPNAVVGVSRASAGDVRQEIALGKDVGLVELRRVEAIDPARVELHRQRIDLAKSAVANAELAATRSITAPEVARAEADLEAAAVRVETAAAQLAPTERAAAAEIGVYAKAFGTLRSRAALARVGGATDADRIEQRAEDVGRKADDRLARLEGAAQAAPALAVALPQLRDATARFAREMGMLAEDPARGKAALEELPARRAQLTLNLRDRFIELRGLGVAMTDTRDGEQRAEPGVRGAPVAAPNAKLLIQQSRMLPALAGGIKATLWRVGASGGVEAGGAGAGTDTAGAVAEQAFADMLRARAGPQLTIPVEAMSSPEYVQEALARRVVGAGAATNYLRVTKKPGGLSVRGPAGLPRLEETSSVLAASAVRAAVEAGQPSGGAAAPSAYGMVYDRAKLSDPAFYAEQFASRTGGFGYTHTFDSPEAMRDFAQSRVGGYGMVHLRSDLEDPEYVQKLFRERVGGLGWSHQFKDDDEYKQFVQSRLGGLGRVSTCKDLLAGGMSLEKAQGVFAAAERYSKRSFESEADYQRRMMRDNPKEFKRDENGRLVHRSWAEQADERREEMLASGQWVADPRTGNVVRRGTNAGNRVEEELLSAVPRAVRVRTALGFEVDVNVQGFGSLRDALEDEMVRSGHVKDGAGNWIDQRGNVVLSAERLNDFDSRYASAMDERAPGFAKQIAYRAEPDRPKGPPPSVREQMQSARDEVLASLGYRVDDARVGDVSLGTIEVRPGEDYAQALRRAAEASGRVRFDDAGNAVDARTGRVLLTLGEIDEKDAGFRDKVAQAVFGDGQAGLSREAQFLANYGDAQQQASAQQIVSDLRGRAQALNDVTTQQDVLREELDDLDGEAGLSPVERARRRQALERELDSLATRRTQVETGLAEAGKAANASARQVVEESLTYHEREALRLGERAEELAGRVESLQADLARAAPYERREIERALARAQTELYEAGRAMNDAADALEQPAKVAQLVEQVNYTALGVSVEGARDAREARARAVSVEFREEGGRRFAVYRDADGRPIVDPTGRAIEVSEVEGGRFVERQVHDLARRAPAVSKASEDYEKLNREIEDLRFQLLTNVSASERRRLERLLQSKRADADVLAESVNAFVRELGGLDETGRAAVREESARLREERERVQREYDTGARGIEYTDENGETKVYYNERARAYMDEQARLREEEAQRALALADRAVAESDRQAEAAARRAALEAADAERARREAMSQQQREQQSRLDGELAGARSALQSAEGREAAARAERDRARARVLTENTDAARAALAEAEQSLAVAQAFTSRETAAALSAAAAAAGNNPEVGRRLADQRAKAEAALTQTTALESELLRLTKAAAEARGRADRGELSGEEAARAEEQLRAARERYLTAKDRAAAEFGAFNLMADNATFSGASAQFNKSRLDELEAERASGGDRAWSAQQREEYDRRRSIASYHDNVAAAQGKAEALATLAARERAAPGTLSARERVELDQGLSDAELRLLLGDAQRRGLEAALGQQPGVEAESVRAMIGRWMADPSGGQRGERLLQEADTTSFLESLGFLNRTDAAAAGVAEAQRRLEVRKQELAEWQAQYDANRDEYHASQLSRSRELVGLAEQRLGDAQSVLSRAEQTTYAQWERRAGASAETLEALAPRGESYLDAAFKEVQRQQAASAAEAQRAYEPYRQARERYEQGQQEIRAWVEQSDAQHQRERTQLDGINRELTDLREQKTFYEKKLSEMGVLSALSASEQTQNARQFYQKKIAQLGGQIDDKQRTAEVWTRSVRGYEAQRTAVVQAREKALPKPWELDPALKTREDLARTEEYLRVRQDQEYALAAQRTTLAELDARVAELASRLERARAADDGSDNELERMYNDAAKLRQDRAAVIWRSGEAAEQMVREIQMRNRSDGLGPQSDYDLGRFLGSAGTSLDAALRVDESSLDQVRQSAAMQVDGAIKSNISRSEPWLATQFVREVYGDNPLKTLALLTPPGMAYAGAARALGYDPFEGTGTLALAAKPEEMLKGLWGTAQGAATGAKELVVSLPAAAHLAGETLAPQLFGDEELQKLWGAYDAFKALPDGSVNRLAWNYLRSLDGPNASENFGRLGGRVGFEVATLFYTPSAANAAAGLTKAATTLERAGVAVAKAGEVSRFPTLLAATERALAVGEVGLQVASKPLEAISAGAARAEALVGRAAGGLGAGFDHASEAFATARRALNDSRIGRSVNETLPGLNEVVGSVARAVYDPAVLSAEEFASVRRLATALDEADKLIAHSAKASGEESARLLQQAQALRESVSALGASNPRVLRELDTYHSLDEVFRSLAVPTQSAGEQAMAASRAATGERAARALSESLTGLGVPADQSPVAVAGQVRRALDRAGAPPESVRAGAGAALTDLVERRDALTRRLGEIDRLAAGTSAARTEHAADLADEAARLRRASEELDRQGVLLRELALNPAPDAATPTRTVDDLALYGPDPVIEPIVFAPPARRAAADKPLSTMDIRNEALIRELQPALPAAKGFTPRAGDVPSAPTARAFPQTLSEVLPDGRTVREAVVAGKPSESAATRAGLAEFMERNLNKGESWPAMAASLPEADKAVAEQLIDLRRWVFERVKERWPNVKDTGSAGKFSNDLDFSNLGDAPGEQLLAIDRFLASEIELAPGVKGLGNWRQKLNMDTFTDPSLIHLYDRVRDPAARAQVVRDGALFAKAELAELEGLEHAMPPEAFQRLLRTLRPEETPESVAAAISREFSSAKPKDELLRDLDGALARFRSSGSPDDARAVSELQVLINRVTEDAYRTPGGVKQTVSYKEGLVPFDQPLDLRLPSGRSAEDLSREFKSFKRFENINELRKFSAELKTRPPTPENLADAVHVRRQLNVLEDRMLRLDPVERYQTVLSNVHFFEHQLQAAGGDALLAMQRYQTSKYLTRVFGEAGDVPGIEAGANTFLREAQTRLTRFYKERGPIIERYFGGERTLLSDAERAALTLEAEEFVDIIRDVNATLARRARTDATAAIEQTRAGTALARADDAATRAAIDEAQRVGRRLDDPLGLDLPDDVPAIPAVAKVSPRRLKPTIEYPPASSAARRAALSEEEAERLAHHTQILPIPTEAELAAVRTAVREAASSEEIGAKTAVLEIPDFPDPSNPARTARLAVPELPDPSDPAKTARLAVPDLPDPTDPAKTARLAVPDLPDATDPAKTARLAVPDMPPGARPPEELVVEFVKDIYEPLTPAELEAERRLQRGLDLFLKDHRGSVTKLKEAINTGAIKGDDLNIVEEAVKQFQSTLVDEIAYVRVEQLASTRAANKWQQAFAEKHPNFVKAQMGLAEEIIRRDAALGDPIARAMVEDLDAGLLSLTADARVEAFGYNKKTQVAFANIFALHGASGRPVVRHPVDLASTLYHEYIHERGFNEVRAWAEQLRFINRHAGSVGDVSKFPGKWDQAAKFKATEAKDPAAALAELQTGLANTYRSKYTPERLKETLLADAPTWEPVRSAASGAPRAAPRKVAPVASPPAAAAPAAAAKAAAPPAGGAVPHGAQPDLADSVWDLIGGAPASPGDPIRVRAGVGGPDLAAAVINRVRPGAGLSGDDLRTFQQALPQAPPVLAEFMGAEAGQIRRMLTDVGGLNVRFPGATVESLEQALNAGRMVLLLSGAEATRSGQPRWMDLRGIDRAAGLVTLQDPESDLLARVPLAEFEATWVRDQTVSAWAEAR